MRRLFASILTALVGLNVTGCGTIFHGTKQDVPVAVTPPGTEVAVYRWSGELVAGPQVSPGEVTVPRPKGDHRSYLVRASKPGYCPKYWLTGQSITAGTWSYLWMAFLGALIIIPIMAIDSATGGCCAVDPGTIEGALMEEAQC